MKKLVSVMALLIIPVMLLAACDQTPAYVCDICKQSEVCICVSDTVFRKGNTRFIAHRGYSSLHPDNSIEGFVAAGQEDFFWGIETDIWWMANDFYLSHSRPKSVNRLPTLSEFLEICASHNKVAVIDIWDKLNEHTAKQLLLQTKGFEILLLSRNVVDLQLLKSLGSKAPMQMLYSLPQNITWEFGLSMNFTWMTDERFIQAQAHGVDTAVWTVNSEIIAQKFVDMGIDYLTTDYVFN